MMQDVYKILIFGIIFALVFVLVFSIVTQVKSGHSLKITGLKSEYSPTEDVIISGTAKENCEILVFYNDQMGSLSADNSGKWVVNLGTMPTGRYDFQVLANESAISEISATAKIVVTANADEVSFLKNLMRFFGASISSLQSQPNKLITVPQNTPEVLKGNWRLLK